MGSESGDRRIKVALIGAGIERSLSPVLHEREGSVLGFDYAYELRDLGDDASDPAAVAAAVAAARSDGLRGLNVTHPSKQLVLGALDRLSPEAEALAAVNTVVFSPEGATGHNTDISGFRTAFTTGLPGAATRRIAVAGAGGAGAAVAFALLGLQAGQVRLVDTAPDRAETLASNLEEHFRAGRAVPASLEEALDGADGLVHATPTGMGASGETAVDPSLLHRGLWVAEVVYVPLDTQLLRDARAAGCITLDGGRMVAAQAGDSLQLFTGVEPDRARITAHMAELLAGEREVVS
jgi:shikimate dehydrogenase